MTWWCLASSASVRPSTAPSRPPTPVSISSKTSVGTRSAPARTVLTASVTRDSSPPEAIFRSGRGASPGLGEKTNSTRSRPDSGGVAAVGSSPGSCAATSTESFAPSRPSALRRPWIALANAFDVRWRAAERAVAATISARQASARGASRPTRSASSCSMAASCVSTSSRRAASSSARSGTARPGGGRTPGAPRPPPAARGRRPSRGRGRGGCRRPRGPRRPGGRGRPRRRPARGSRRPEARPAARPARAAPAPSGRPRRAGRSPRPSPSGAARRWRRRCASRTSSSVSPGRGSSAASSSRSNSSRARRRRRSSAARISSRRRRRSASCASRRARYSASAASWPPCASSRSRWRSGSSRACPSRWPWTSIRRAPSAWRVATVTGIPLACAAPRPCAETRRVRINWSSSSGPPRIASTSALRGGVGHLEHGGGARLALAGADQVGRRLAPQHQPQGRQQQALARPRLAGPGAVALLELDAGVLDQRQVLDGQFAEHGPPPPSSEIRGLEFEINDAAT